MFLEVAVVTPLETVAAVPPCTRNPCGWALRGRAAKSAARASVVIAASVAAPARAETHRDLGSWLSRASEAALSGALARASGMTLRMHDRLRGGRSMTTTIVKAATTSDNHRRGARPVPCD